MSECVHDYNRLITVVISEFLSAGKNILTATGLQLMAGEISITSGEP